ncbi:MAG: MFS transporter [Theionarchaea archaeon]|nr:MFS transporter [Theionarchaea archaeon]
MNNSQLCTLLLVTFLGNTSLWLFLPFILIYINTSLGISVTIGGMVLAINTLLRMGSLWFAGELSDRFGRKTLLILSLVTRIFIFTALYFMQDILSFMVLYCVMGIFISLGDPARDAMVADIVPESQRVTAYSYMRVAINGALIAGSTVGGIIASYTLPAVFAGAALLCGITTLIGIIGLKETYSRHNRVHSISVVIKDANMLLLSAVMVVVGFMLANLHVILPIHGKLILSFTESQIGTFLALNGVLVVICQVPVSRIARMLGSLKGLVVGCCFFVGGLWSMLYAQSYFHIGLVVLMITFGELFILPITTAMVSTQAPQDIRGAYLGLYNLSVYAGFALNSFIGAYLFDLNAQFIWILSGIMGIGALLGFLSMKSNSVPPGKNTP